jgi:hypothetical protein
VQIGGLSSNLRLSRHVRHRAPQRLPRHLGGPRPWARLAGLKPPSAKHLLHRGWTDTRGGNRWVECDLSAIVGDKNPGSPALHRPDIGVDSDAECVDYFEAFARLT